MRKTTQNKFAGPLAQGVSDLQDDSLFFGKIGREVVCPQGGVPDQTRGARAWHTPSTFFLKIDLFFNLFFSRFWLDLGSQICSKIDQNPRKIVFESASKFKVEISSFLYHFFFDFRDRLTVKI